MTPSCESQPIDWSATYGRLAGAVPDLAAAATPIVTGFEVCLDRIIDLHAVAPSLSLLDEPGARGLFAELMARVQRGRGGELLVSDWPDGPAFLDPATLPDGIAIGGTSAQAAWTLAEMGAPAVLALGDAGSDELSVLHPGIGIVTAAGLLGSSLDRRPSPTGKPAHYILEYTAGRPLLGITPERSTRIIVRFADEELQTDALFDAWITAHGHRLRAGLLSSPNTVPFGEFPAALDRLTTTARAWRRAGLVEVHLELAAFPWPGACEATLERLGPEVTSIGLNQNELGALVPGDHPVAQADELSRRYGIGRLVVHADGWALAITHGDPAIEFDALATGCLVAAARAAAGEPPNRPRLPLGARFGSLPAPSVGRLADGRSVVCVAAPYLSNPRSTVGLGDSFAAGSLLVHSIPDYRPRLTAAGSPIPSTPPER